MIKLSLNTSIEETQKNTTKRRVSGEFICGVSCFGHPTDEDGVVT
jgi:hypothetical protein